MKYFIDEYMLPLLTITASAVLIMVLLLIAYMIIQEFLD